MGQHHPGDAQDNEADRVRRTYHNRGQDQYLAARYRLDQPAQLLLLQERERALLDLLRATGFSARLGEVKALDIGCGAGGHLLDLVRWGADPANLAGVDLMPDRLEAARQRLPTADLRLGDAARLPFADGAFHLVSQFTVFSSIRQPSVRTTLAKEMARVLQPGGLILSYDLRWPNPANPDVEAIPPRELRRLFPGAGLHLRTLTLAPPLARRLAPRAWWLACLLQSVPALRSHLLAAIAPH